MELSLAGETQLTVEPDERNLALLAPGQKALASAEAFPEQRFAARVVYLSPGVDAQRGTVEMRLAVDEPPPYLRPDMTVSVEVEVARRRAALVVPSDAVREPASLRPWVLTVRAGRAARQDVRLGARGERLVEVIEGAPAEGGLSPGEMVLLPAGRLVLPGQRVRPRLTER
jgi:HlyD family secretion protein